MGSPAVSLRSLGDGMLPGFLLKLTNAVLESFLLVNCSLFFPASLQNVAARSAVCTRVVVVGFFFNFIYLFKNKIR